MTSESDVWSFGVLLWEMFSLGDEPYPGIPSEDILSFMLSNRRMNPPKHCPQKVQQESMSRCKDMITGIITLWTLLNEELLFLCVFSTDSSKAYF